MENKSSLKVFKSVACYILLRNCLHTKLAFLRVIPIFKMSDSNAANFSRYSL